MKPVQRQQKHDFFLYDQDSLEHVGCDEFNLAYYKNQGALRGQAQGRGTTYFVTLATQLDCVLRHYRRGGLMANLTEDSYYWMGINRTRAWREWLLLKNMLELKLPVPQPIAAHVKHNGLFYSADIITRQIPSAHSLSVLLANDEMSDELWRLLGITIKQFHQQGIYHADLNAHNILVDENEEFYLIDFDKGKQRAPSAAWQRANIERLHRSLLKLKKQNSGGFHFSLHHWGALLQAYSSGS